MNLYWVNEENGDVTCSSYKPYGVQRGFKDSTEAYKYSEIIKKRNGDTSSSDSSGCAFAIIKFPFQMLFYLIKLLPYHFKNIFAKETYGKNGKKDGKGVRILKRIGGILFYLCIIIIVSGILCVVKEAKNLPAN